jgi:hypothetical protein
MLILSEIRTFKIIFKIVSELQNKIIYVHSVPLKFNLTSFEVESKIPKLHHSDFDFFFTIKFGFLLCLKRNEPTEIGHNLIHNQYF